MILSNFIFLLTNVVDKELDIITTIGAVVFAIVMGAAGIIVAIKKGRITIRSIIKDPGILKEVAVEAIEEAKKKLDKAEEKGDEKKIEQMTQVIHALETLDAEEIQKLAAEKAKDPKIDNKE